MFNEDHELFRNQYIKFLEREVEPHAAQWEKDGILPREVWLSAAKNGYLCPWIPKEYGGLGLDYLYDIIIAEETAIRSIGFLITSQNDVVVPYIYNFGTEEQKRKYLPGCVTGDYICAVAMTEPNAGSDLQGIQTKAVKDGDHYILNGQKCFIGLGILNSLVIVAAKTDTKIQPQYKGISLFIVDNDCPGYKRGRRHEKMGWHSQDTAELIFEDCRVPESNLLGGEGNGFRMLMKELQQERLIISVCAVAIMKRILNECKKYINTRKAFGQFISAFQNTRFQMAEMYTTYEMCQVFLDRLIEEHIAGHNVDMETAMAKYFLCDSLKTIADKCLQFYGGYGFMEEYRICQDYRDARVFPIMGGSSEVQKEIIANSVLK
ncbi:MAG: acyl-CoA dehydrogenase family protein [Syntrophales bacterium]|nr:acyl-CoA dehydrogenase family protein [Syntrophales bacterium]